MPSLEGRVIEVNKETSLLSMIERKAGMSPRFFRKLKFETGEEAYINIGVNTKIIPYYTEVKYFLDPDKEFTAYYLLTLGVNLVDGDDIEFDKFLNDFSQSINYGIGVGITIRNIELEILFGKYNYQNIGNPQEKDKSLYSSTKITFACKYKF